MAMTRIQHLIAELEEAREKIARRDPHAPPVYRYYLLRWLKNLEKANEVLAQTSIQNEAKTLTCGETSVDLEYDKHMEEAHKCKSFAEWELKKWEKKTDGSLI